MDDSSPIYLGNLFDEQVAGLRMGPNKSISGINSSVVYGYDKDLREYYLNNCGIRSKPAVLCVLKFARVSEIIEIACEVDDGGPL